MEEKKCICKCGDKESINDSDLDQVSGGKEIDLPMEED